MTANKAFPESRSTTPQSPYTYRQVIVGIGVLLIGALIILFLPVSCYILSDINNTIGIIGLLSDVFGAMILVLPETNARRWLTLDALGRLERARYILFIHREYFDEDEMGFDELRKYLLRNYGQDGRTRWSANPDDIYAMEYDPSDRELVVHMLNARPTISDADAINHQIDSIFSGFFYRAGACLLVLGFSLQIISRLGLPC